MNGWMELLEFLGSEVNEAGRVVYLLGFLFLLSCFLKEGFNGFEGFEGFVFCGCEAGMDGWMDGWMDG